jgi:hypothetical protein
MVGGFQNLTRLLSLGGCANGQFSENHNSFGPSLG